MTDEIIIKREDGKTISVTATQEASGIVLTKTGDKTAEHYKRKFIIEAMDMDVYKRFVATTIIEENRATRIMGFIKHLVK